MGIRIKGLAKRFGGTAAVVLQTLSCFYYLFFFAPFAAAYCVYEIVARRRWPNVRVWRHLAVAGVLALALIVIPVVIRTTENMLLLVPDGLREAASALGAPRAMVIKSVTWKAAKAGIVAKHGSRPFRKGKPRRKADESAEAGAGSPQLSLGF